MIKGLTDRGLAFPEIGQIRKGSPKTKNERGIEVVGKDLKYFRVEFDQNEQESIKKFQEVYGKEPTEINIFLPFKEVSRVWDAYYEAYTAGRMIARADGEKFLYKVDSQTGVVEVYNGEPETKFDKSQPVGFYVTTKGEKKPIFARPVGRLRVIVKELKRLAYLTVLTTSIYDILNISQELDAIEYINGNSISGVPLVLKRVPRMISTPSSDGKRARREKWLLSIEAHPKWVDSKIPNMEALSYPVAQGLLHPAEIPMLPASNQTDIDADEDDSDIPPFAEGEFIDQEPDAESIGAINEDVTGEIKPEEILKATKSQVVEKCVALGGRKNEALMEIVKSFEPSGNPNKIKDIDVLNELSVKLVELEEKGVK